MAISGALALLTNITMAWNTHHLDSVFKDWQEKDPKMIDTEMLRHITPVRFEYINFRGVFAFRVGPYRERIFGRALDRAHAAKENRYFRNDFKQVY